MAGRRLISGRQALAVEMDMRQGLYAHLVRLSFGFYDRHQTGQLMSRATVDLQGVRFFLGYGLIFFFQNVLTIASVTVVLFVYEWQLAFVALAITPILAGLSYRYSRIAHPPRASGSSRCWTNGSRSTSGRAGSSCRRVPGGSRSRASRSVTSGSGPCSTESTSTSSPGRQSR